MRRMLPLLLLVLALPALAQARTVSHVLAWTYDGAAPQWWIDQCATSGPPCTLTPVASVPGSWRRATMQRLDPRLTYCWQVRLPSGQVSNTVCTNMQRRVRR